ncbi:CerR family C-terminal domain-containing protein [Gilvimarinus sp. 1_MG-2023]|uniref:CerR family C-terminal domain-containing protein n=1 Tax=Gilvimarinus sp. 1_MG-2023 TaxID=3062638 RepID=UPI0026E351BC|nr:CerR family C-terminal domain-containing protein [Gilvimarinus sp. 1_MG-2023]MDO6746399.1 CerR family C-terminal domain-containing protein [Gilvimarinus sp. 1_MG-2023]
MPERELTAQKLLIAGMHLFGDLGFKGTTTRMIADKAGANIGSIAYYFGNKQGLYIAIAREINTRLTEKLKLDHMPSPDALSPDQIQKEITHFLHRLVDLFAADKEAEQWLMFVQREQISPSEAFDELYQNAFHSAHSFLSQLIARFCQLPNDNRKAILQTHLLIGQVIFLLTGRTPLLRRLNLQQKQLSQDTIDDVKIILESHIKTLPLKSA